MLYPLSYGRSAADHRIGVDGASADRRRGGDRLDAAAEQLGQPRGEAFANKGRGARAGENDAQLGPGEQRRDERLPGARRDRRAERSRPRRRTSIRKTLTPDPTSTRATCSGRRTPTSTEADAEQAEAFNDGEYLRDINTPESSPSGNIHGMPLAALLGRGHQGGRAVGLL